jgi:hypothetical protein
VLDARSGDVLQDIRTLTGPLTVIEGLDLGTPVIPHAFPHGIFNGVTVGANGSIDVSDDGANAVYEFKRSPPGRDVLPPVCDL